MSKSLGKFKPIRYEDDEFEFRQKQKMKNEDIKQMRLKKQRESEYVGFELPRAYGNDRRR